jgi:hypothetical protein
MIAVFNRMLLAVPRSTALTFAALLLQVDDVQHVQPREGHWQQFEAGVSPHLLFRQA